MAKIKHNNKVIKYKPQIIVLHEEPINKEIALENMRLLNNIMVKNKIKYSLVWGTCLGAIRDKDFITHDTDCDIALTVDNFYKVLDCIDEFLNVGFEIARYDLRGHFSLIRFKEYIDIIAYKDMDSDCYLACNMYILPRHFLDDLKIIDFLGEKLPVPREAEDYLRFEYGANWRTPIKRNVTKRGQISGTIRSIIKNILPGFIKLKIWNILGKKEFEKYKGYYKEYLEWKNESSNSR